VGDARAADPSSGGRQTPGNFGSRRRGVIIGSSTVGPQIPKAAGIGLALKWRGEGALCYVSFGEGATSQGDFHEGLNFAAIHRCPVIFFCENNHWAISVPQRLQVAGPGVAERAAAYGIPGMRVSGDDFFTVHAVVQEAVNDGVRRQVEAGVSIVSDGELGKVGYSTYIIERLSGFGGHAERKPALDLAPLPDLRRKLAAIMGDQEFTRASCIARIGSPTCARPPSAWPTRATS